MNSDPSRAFTVEIDTPSIIVLRDSLNSPKTRLLQQLSMKNSKVWWHSVVVKALEEITEGLPSLGPELLPAPAALRSLKQLGHKMAKNAVGAQVVEAACLYFSASLLFDGHPDRPRGERLSSLDWRELSDVYSAFEEALGDDWPEVIQRAHRVNEE